MAHQKILCVIGGVINFILISSILLLFISSTPFHLEIVSQFGIASSV